LVWLAAAAGGDSLVAAEAAAPIDFNRQIRPILSDNCFQCHGPDEGSREANLRFDLREAALQPAKSGGVAIVPGDPARSELILRVTDEHEAMPPAETGKKLKPAEVALLRQWIAEGAPYAPHWAFVPPVATLPPAPARGAWGRNEIDRFVLARLEQEKLRPAAEADKATLLRRVSFDLTGLPPAVEALDAFLADPRPDAYERVVERLLASPHFGERMATDWLDAARYADSNGFFRDNTRQIWPWRDWVIQAFNRNQPFDQFTIEQLAGDLLPNPTPAQRIATGFNRNHMVTGETGVIDEEYRVEYVADRLETTSTVWLGLTVACARCHDHKYDPISQRDYYQLFAFFNSGVEKGTIAPDDPPPVMDVTSPEQKLELDRLSAARRVAEESFAQRANPLQPRMVAWEASAAVELQPPRQGVIAQVDFEPEGAKEPGSGHPAGPRAAEKGAVYFQPGLVGQSAMFDGMQHLELPADTPIVADRPWTVGLWVKPSTSLVGVMSKIEPTGDRRGFELIWAKGQLQINLVDRWVVSAIELTTRDPIKRIDWNHVVISYDGSRRAAGVKVYADGLEVPLIVVRDSLQGPITNREPLRIGRRDSGLGYYGQLDEFRLLDRAVTATEARSWYWSDRLQGILALDTTKRDARQKKLLLDYFVERHADDATRAAHRVAAARREDEDAYRARLPKTLVMQEVASPKPTHLLKRGQYDAPGELVQADVPGALSPWPAEAPRNRLGLAQWLVSPAHPLTARVAVNRLWLQCFGEGIVPTLNDFGLQGELPSHPELLDWLAVRFASDGWNVKEMLRLLVTSATYRQSSVPSRELLERDPNNRLLARGPRFRLPAEMIRDQALAVSELLVPTMGGPPVKPYQPPGLWEAVSYNGELSYETDRGDGLWRRTVYTHWKRTSPPPGVLVLDGPTRETCVVRRPRTNTPLQSLLLLNDETYVEAARVLAATTLASGRGGSAPDATARAMFRRLTARSPEAAETAALRDLYAKQKARFAADRDAARKLIGVGMSPRGRELDPVELATWTVVGQALLNLDEVVMRR
jgi:mono/diheme cytochrome c family protein